MTDIPSHPASSVVVRPATADDMRTVGRLAALLVRLHHEFDPPRFLAPRADTAQGYGSWLRSQLEEPSVVILVAERDGDVVGYTYAGLEEHDWMALRGPAGVLHDILVDPAARGTGAGQRLLDATIAALEAKGAPRVVLSTAAKNDGAQRFFERAGFRRTMIEMTRERGGAEPATG